MAKEQHTVELIVGVGTSAGGLEALKRFFSKISSDAPFAFIVVQHLDPNHKSMLADILARNASFNFCQATNNQKIEIGNAYIIPPNKFIEVIDKKIKIIEQPEHRGTRKAIDHLFRSMADVYQSKAVGLIFSGAGSDGTAGLRELKAAGGLAVVQTPDSAEYPSMPRSAINAGVVDEILPIEKIPDLLLEYAAHPYHQLKDSPQPSVSEDLAKISAVLKTQEHFDLSQYKKSTVKRRLYRRMGLTNKATTAEYLSMLRGNEKERLSLMRDLLINVTDFFRDREAFEILDTKVIANIVDEVEEGEDIRVWVAGCASGEEAYTLAILFLEQIEKLNKDLGLRIFATDIDEEAISTARKGTYSNSIISELPEAFVEKYFDVDSKGYAVVRSRIRDVISFANQNVYTDPPFSKLHLVSCRNLLIYLQVSAQQRVLKSFFYSLLPEGYLFLGSSESTGEQKELFNVLSSKWRIYCRKKRDKIKRHQSSLPSFYNRGDGKKRPSQHRQDAAQQGEDDWVKQTLLMAVKPSIIVDGQNNIVYFHGNVNIFLQLPEDGQAVLNLYSMLHPDIRTRMRSGIYKAKKSSARVSVTLPHSNERLNFRCTITPTTSQNSNDDANVIITFEELPSEVFDSNALPDLISHKDQDSMIDSMERELRETKDELQSTVEELETSTEELKASHEEALSTNEELQSSNEELEASTEELRSLNEELTTVNAQLKDNIHELSSTHDDIKNFFASTNLATIFLSSDYRVKRFTPAAERLLRIGSQDIDQPINELCRDLIDEDTLEESKRVLDSLESSEKQVKANNKWFIRKILPYQTESRQVDGVVITFIDVTTLKITANRLESSSEQHAVIAKLGMKALATDDTENLMDQLVREVAHTLQADFCKVLQYLPDSQELLMKAGVGWDSGLVGTAVVPASNSSQGGFTLFATEPVVVDDLANEQRFTGPELLTEHKVVSGISCIIENGAHPYGVLGVHTKDKRKFNKEDVHFLVSAANILSVALHRRGMEKQLKANESRLSIAKDAAHLGSFEWDFDTNIIYWDRMLHDIWGVEGDKATYDDFIDGIHEHDREVVAAEIEAAMDPRGSGHYNASYRVVHSTTQNITWLEANGQVLFKSNQPLKMIGMVVDITRQRKLETSLKKAVKELQEANEKKNDFLAVLGHEIRNPLASINAAVQITENAPEKLDWALGTMKSNVNLVSSLLDELLDLTRISKGEISLKKTAVNINALVNEVVQNFKATIQYNDQNLSVDVTDEPIITYVDRIRIQQVINNIINNAAKFTPKNGLIKIRLSRAGDDLLIEVEDSGIGLDMQFKNKIFEPFHQIKESLSANNNGLGIGLSLVKQITELHGGDVAISSEGKNKGAKVALSLPIVAVPVDEQPDADQAVATSDLKKLTRLRVMLVDDNETVSDGLSLILNLKGCEVTAFNTGQQAIDNFLSFNPNVVLLDIGLPDMSGNELIKKIKPKLPSDTLFLAITGYGHEEARRSTSDAGFHGHFNKPVEIDIIVSELLRFADRLSD